jgi:hypothetical protein
MDNRIATDLERIGNRLLVTYPHNQHGHITTSSFRWGTLLQPVGGSDYVTFTTAPIPGTSRALLLGKHLSVGRVQGYLLDGSIVSASPWILPLASFSSLERITQIGPWVMELRNGIIWNGESEWIRIDPYPDSGTQSNKVVAATYFDDAIVFGGKWTSLQGSTSLLRRLGNGTVTALGTPPNGTILALYTDGDSLLAGGSFIEGPSAISPFLARFGPVSDRAVRITSNPVPVRNCSSRNSFFSVAVAGAGPILYQWRRNGVPLTDGVTPTGSRISGSAGGVLTIGPATRGRVSLHDEGMIDCVVSNSCGSVITTPIEFKVLGADFNCNLQVNDADFVTFAVAYDAVACPNSGAAASCFADLNVDGIVDDADFQIFALQYDQY